MYQIWQEDYLPEVDSYNSRLLTFDYAAAIVADSGGPLSHRGVVARGYGLPCVAGTCTGSRTIPDGARITVDGAQGIVRIEG